VRAPPGGAKDSTERNGEKARLEESEMRTGANAMESFAAGGVSWGTSREGVVLCLSPNTLRKTLRIALIVGTLLSLINQWHVIAAGEASTVTWIRVAANYLIPWVVSSVGFLSASRREPARKGGAAIQPYRGR
jgi:hypothetical protein